MNKLIQILKFNGHLWRYYSGIAIFTVLVSLLGLAEPFWVKQIIDELSRSISTKTPVNVDKVLIFTGAIFVSYLLFTVLQNIQGYFGDMMTIKLKRHLSERYYNQLLYLPQKYFDNELSGTIINRLSRSIESMSRFINMWVNNFISMFLTIGIGLVIIATIAWPSALLLAALFPVYVTMTRKTSGKWQKLEKRKNKHSDAALGRFTESIGQIKAVRAYQQESREYNFFAGRYQKIVSLTNQQSKLWHRDDIRRKLVVDTIFFLSTAFVVYKAAQGTVSIGEMVLVLQYALAMRFPLNSMSFLVDNFQQAIVGSEDYLKVMALKSEEKSVSVDNVERFDKASLSFKDVTFAYEDAPVLKKLSFTIPSGTKVALVGESGEGKTTITNLILQLYQPGEGTILINDRSYDELGFDQVRANVAVVFQDPTLFSGTIKENIAYGMPAASDEAIERASRAANAHNFIEKLPKGYLSEIGERGVKLSGGQKQRIAIARAILKDAPLLLLDEATSSLDSKSEALVQEALERLMKNRTTLIIAHRLSTIQNVDMIVTLRGGMVDEIGSPRELSKSGGIYAQLLSLQKELADGNTSEVLKKFEIAG